MQPLRGPKCLTDWATLADEDLETINSFLNNRQEILYGNQRYLIKKVIGEAKTCNFLDKTQILSWLSYLGRWMYWNKLPFINDCQKSVCHFTDAKIQYAFLHKMPFYTTAFLQYCLLTPLPIYTTAFLHYCQYTGEPLWIQFCI